ncbi:MAG: class I SAM-dependent methyltransferase [Candidatus Hydrogenedentes bacterium]|nr:class I SAM-dependent methyltransferase [Candidatus Hydrogenedentota bacterium]
MKRPQAVLFDALAAGEQLYVYPQESLKKLNALIPDKGRTLDVGCGDGAIPAAFDAEQVFGFDVSPRCARLSSRCGVPSIVADATQALPFAAESFDTVYCVDVLHHLEGKQPPLLREIHRILRPEGRLAIVEPDARNPFVRITQAPDSLLRVAPYNNEPAIDPNVLLSLLNDIGFLCTCDPIHITGEQVVRSVFPMWQRLAKAPFVLVLAFVFRNRPNKFAILAKKNVGRGLL